MACRLYVYIYIYIYVYIYGPLHEGLCDMCYIATPRSLMIIQITESQSMTDIVVVVILFPTQYKQWRTAYKSSITPIRKQ